MTVILCNTFSDFCVDGTTEADIEGFALIRLVNQADGALYYATDGHYIPSGTTYSATIDPTTGTWQSCELPCNSDLTPAGSYYEVEEWVNGTCQQRHLVQLDCANVAYPVPPLCTDIADVSLNSPTGSPTSLLCPVVEACETPWVGVAGDGIAVTAGDNAATGAVGNGHAPTIAVAISADANNALAIGGDQGLFVQTAAMETWATKHKGRDDADFLEQLKANPSVAKHFKTGELEKLCSIDFHLKEVNNRFKAVGL